eukprot:TRINITY_DN544_c0_g1_i1.p1 TRINITY_DN544_c0_g1~~TRINITY_DN544_c0_g1_i1.p1  ORF type:complete len:868 (-),score=207.39 TRINITY_DN544_c0_g1_i1:77-2680(-)
MRGSRYEHPGAVKSWLLQAKIMLYKNYKLAYRGWGTTLVEILSPIIVLLILLILQNVSTAAQNANKDPQPQNLNWLPCHGRTESDPVCYRIFYSLSPDYNSTTPHTVMQILGKQRGFEIMTVPYSPLANDSAYILSNSSYYNKILYWEWPKTATPSAYPPFYDFLAAYPNTTQAAFLFSPDSNSVEPSVWNYTIYYNNSCPQGPFITCENSLYSATNSLYSAIVAYYNNQSIDNTHYNVFYTSYPIAAPPNDSVKSYGALMFYIGNCFFFVILLYKIVYEKEHKLRMGLRMMGLKGTAYWLSWFVHSQIIVTITALLLTLTGWVCRFEFFTKTNLVVLFIVFYVFGFTMAQLAFFFATLLPNTKQTIYVSMAVVILGVILSYVTSLLGPFLFVVLYGPDPSTTALTFRYFLSILPMWNFGQSIFAISLKSYKLGSASGDGFSFSDFWHRVDLGDGVSTMPSVAATVLVNLIEALVFTILAWYCDNVVSGHGSPEKFWFPFDPTYWGFAQRTPHRDAHYKPINDEVSTTGLYARNLSKTYTKLFGKSVNALLSFSTETGPGNTLCILGHNGAGKTTLISILTGLHPPTSGYATIAGYDLETEMHTIRKTIGVCPQHDILWNDLTAYEHLSIFADLKGIPSHLKASVIQNKLSSVALLDVQHNRVGSYSGGMKRRLSVAISFIGEPTIVFLDEPSTGMDPVSKRKVWDLVQKEKVGKVIILTTHSMEEADVLGDRIVIMANGGVVTEGRALELKNRYGEGYRLNVKIGKGGEGKKWIGKIVGNDGRCVEESGEWMVWVVKGGANNGNGGGSSSGEGEEVMEDVGRIVEICRELEENGAENGVEDFGLSHCTLEEVFLKLTREANVNHNR